MAATDDGQRFVFADEGEGPLVVLIHGFPDTPHGWERIAAGLAEAGFRAVRRGQSGPQEHASARGT